MQNNNQFIQPISASPGFANRINPSGDLQQITKHVVIYLNSDQFDVYRKSTHKPGYFSRETYTKQKDASFKISEKDSDKYENPVIPENAFSYNYNEVILYSLQRLTEDQVSSLGQFIDSVHN